ncbi:MAG TPA: hypothetical protein ENJ44_04065 [Oceanospirillales bacterium]|nr:hypothetical protein [Oceanospirillales bacterium]
MKAVQHIVLSLFFITFFSGCINKSMNLKPAETLNPSKGYLVASVTKGNVPQANDAWYYYKNKATNKEARLDALGFVMFTRPDDFPEDKNRNGRLLAIPLTPGGYQLVNWTLLVSQIMGGYAYISPKTPPTPFDFNIKAGEVTYIGSLHLDTLTGKNLFGMKIPVGGRSSISNKQKTDIPLLEEKYPNLKKLPITINVPEKGGWNSL